jgi:uncharacterized damage-inducible protein DinB
MLPTLVAQYQCWFRYETDSHSKVLASLGTIPVQHRSTALFQKALTIFGHIVAARRIWLYRLGFSLSKPTSLFPAKITQDELTAELQAMEGEWQAYLQALSDTELGRVLEYRTTEGEEFQNIVADVLTHLYGHSLYHRGQIASLVRALDGQPAATDFVFWTREPIDHPATQ